LSDLKTLKDLEILSIEGPALSGAVMYRHDIKQMLIERIKELMKRPYIHTKWEEGTLVFCPDKSDYEDGQIKPNDYHSQTKGAIWELIEVGNITEDDLKETKQ